MFSLKEYSSGSMQISVEDWKSSADAYKTQGLFPHDFFETCQAAANYFVVIVSIIIKVQH